jgi:translation initiation factor 5B
MENKKQIRQPIVTIAGHVDHGKTSILDCFRGSCVAKQEAGGITQKISFTLFPIEKVKEACPLIKEREIKLEIPGFLFIDTPGHAAFTNLRKRGGNLADLAILVMDLNEGIKPQTSEVIGILKKNKVPFIIALNKIDNISGWRKQSENLKESIEMQAVHVKQNFDEKLFTIIGALNSHGFDADIYYNISDFTKKIAMVPCSARTGEGIKDLMFVLCGLSQKFLKKKLELGEEAKGVMLEIKREKNLRIAEAILYDGTLSIGDEIAIATFDSMIIGKIRSLEEIKPLSTQFKAAEKVNAAAGIRMQLTEMENILSGMPFVIFKNNKEEILKEFKKEISENVELDAEGIIVKADSLGSLEALLSLLRDANVQILKAGIGAIGKSDISAAEANIEKNPQNAVIVGFNSELEPELKSERIKIISGDVVYKLIDDLKLFQEEKRKEVERQKLMALASIFKVKILHQYVFRNTNPAIFGVAVEKGKLVPGIRMISETGEEIGRVKAIQSSGKSIEEATPGREVAISVPGSNFERKIKNFQYLYSDLGEKQFRDFKKNKELLSQDEISALQEIAEIKRREKITWGV